MGQSLSERPSFPEDDCSASRDLMALVRHFIWLLLGLCWGDASDGSKQVADVEPVDPFKGFPSRALPGNLMVDTSSQWHEVIVAWVRPSSRDNTLTVRAVFNAADRGFDPDLSRAFDISNRDVSAAAIAVMDEIARQSPLITRLFQGIEHELDLRGQCGIRWISVMSAPMRGTV